MVLKNDKFTWAVCLLLFCAGVVWGSVRLKEDFFAVASIHDLFDIFSSIATILALIYAVLNVNAWRKQTKGQADHALAQKLAVQCMKFKESSRRAWDDAVFAICNKNQNPAQHDGERQVRQISADGLADKLNYRRLVKENFEAALLEARAIWGKEAHGLADNMLSFFDICNRCSSMWVYANNTSCTEDVRISLLESVRGYEQHLIIQGWEVGMTINEAKFNSLYADLEKLIQEKTLS